MDVLRGLGGYMEWLGGYPELEGERGLGGCIVNVWDVYMEKVV